MVQDQQDGTLRILSIQTYTGKRIIEYYKNIKNITSYLINGL